MNKFKKWSKIGQFRDVVTQVRQTAKHNNVPLPMLQFKGTVKLHGTNAAIGYNPETNSIWMQSREREITPTSDNAGFASYVTANLDNYTSLLDNISRVHGNTDIIMYGEWAGGNVQSGIAISNIEKTFFVFALKYYVETVKGKDDEGNEIDVQVFNDINISNISFTSIPNLRNINEFPTFVLNVDFNSPELVQNTLAELTLLVEQECPVAKSYGFSGIGEGIVWTNPTNNLMFKTKGDKHSASKVKIVAKLTEEELERIRLAGDFVNVVATDVRLSQGIDKLLENGLELTIKNIGFYLKWVNKDILEEDGDLILAANVDTKALFSKVTAKAKAFFISSIN
jgi:hypothetical protein